MSRDRWWIAALTGIVATGAYFRVAHLDSIPGLNPDEVEVVLQWFRDSIIPWYVAPSGRPHLNPLGPVLLWPFATFAEPSPWVVRAPAVLAGLAVMPATYSCARRAFGREIAVCATMLVASAPLLIAYSRVGWDPAFVPVFAALAVGFAMARRPLASAAAIALLVVIHPTGAYVSIVSAAPFIHDRWVRQGAGRIGRKVMLGFACVIAFTLCTVALSLAMEGGSPWMPVQHLADFSGAVTFAGGFAHALYGDLIHAGFAGGPEPPSAPVIAFSLAVCAAGAGVLLAAMRRTNEAFLLAGLVSALAAQYLSQGPDAALMFRERYLLWAAVPACLVAAAVIQAVADSLSVGRWAQAGAFGIASFWLVAFNAGYLQPFHQTGGESGVLDYRTAKPDPRSSVLDQVRAQRRHPELPAQLFVGEPRLELGLLYLASNDPQVEVRNIGRVLYRYYQRDDRSELARAYEAGSAARDLFFVDYDWARLPGVVRDLHRPVANTPAAIVSPWVLTEIADITTAGGRPLLKLWRLSRP